MTIKNSHFNVLVALNSFILFFLLFAESIQIPAFLQVFGRMHPLFLHFPIVLLVICWLLYLFRERLEKEIPRIERLINMLFYISSITVAITTIFGLILSKEGGFEGATYSRHKYTGVALSFLTLGLLAFTKFGTRKRNRVIFTFGINLSIVLLLFVGHYGASLTHGEDFVIAPISTKKSTALKAENAMVFQDAVLPILQAKCAGCHNSDKAKGGLILTDSSSILKGGENGKVFIAGNALTSLMIQRILKDIEDEHRMPPKGKPQLSIDEVSLLRSWIQSGGKFDVPLSFFTEKDTLFQSVKAIYGLQDNESYDFNPADQEEIIRLTTPYRIINSLDQASPGLDVNFYGKEFYTKSSLSELLAIAEQVVSLNLSSMPVNREDLLILQKFKNLRTLNLNNTQLSNQDLLMLSELTNLRSLSLTGTELNLQGLNKLADLPNVRKIYVWNTNIMPLELDQFSKEYPKIEVNVGATIDNNEELTLTAPKIDPNRSFFKKKILVTLSHPISGVSLRYTLDGSDPDSSTALNYTSAITIEANSLLRVSAQKQGWLKSPEVSQYFYNAVYKPDRVTLETRPNQQYKARKEESFFDLESGSNNNADGRWLGFLGDEMATFLSFDHAVKIDTIALSIKQDYNQHIYPPETIEIWGGMDSLNLKLLNKVELTLQSPNEIKNRRIIACKLPHQELAFIRLKTNHYAKIPEGFPGNGNSPWLFVDEIILK